MNLYLVVRSAMKGIKIPVYYYIFADSEQLNDDEISKLIIATNNYG